MTCSTCNHFTPDEEGYGGIGICALEISRDAIAVVYHKGFREAHHQQSLPYPGQAGCSEWEEIQ